MPSQSGPLSSCSKMKRLDKSALGRALLDRTATACDLLERVFTSQAHFDPAREEHEFTLLSSDYAVTVFGAELSLGLPSGQTGVPDPVGRHLLVLARDPEGGRTMLGVFPSVDDATETVSGIIAAGIVPAALEMLDTLMIQAVEQAFHFGFPTEAGAVLIIEVDGLDAGLDREAQAIAEIVQAHGGTVSTSIAWRTKKEPDRQAEKSVA